MRDRLVVVWRVTTRCNLACPFCAYDRRLDTARVDAYGDLIARMNIADCGPGERYLFIDETGRVAPCSFTTEEYGIPLKAVDIASLPARFTAARSCHRSPQCRDCHSTQVFRKFANSIV